MPPTLQVIFGSIFVNVFEKTFWNLIHRRFSGTPANPIIPVVIPLFTRPVTDALVNGAVNGTVAQLVSHPLTTLRSVASGVAGLRDAAFLDLNGLQQRFITATDRLDLLRTGQLAMTETLRPHQEVNEGLQNQVLEALNENHDQVVGTLANLAAQQTMRSRAALGLVVAGVAVFGLSTRIWRSPYTALVHPQSQEDFKVIMRETLAFNNAILMQNQQLIIMQIGTCVLIFIVVAGIIYLVSKSMSSQGKESSNRSLPLR